MPPLISFLSFNKSSLSSVFLKTSIHPLFSNSNWRLSYTIFSLGNWYFEDCEFCISASFNEFWNQNPNNHQCSLFASYFAKLGSINDWINISLSLVWISYLNGSGYARSSEHEPPSDVVGVDVSKAGCNRVRHDKSGCDHELNNISAFPSYTDSFAIFHHK